MAMVRVLVAMALVASATVASAAPSASSGLAARALDAKLHEPEADASAPQLEVRARADQQKFREQLIGLVPGETLEDVVRTLADKKVQFRVSSDRALVVVRLPLG